MKPYRFHYSKRLEIRLILPLFLLILASGMTGCSFSQKKDAQQLAQAGSATSDQLAAYYATLSQERADYLSLYTLELKRTVSPLQPNLQQSFLDQEAALDARANMASAMKNAYDALGKLVDSGTAGEVNDATEKLRVAIERVNNHPLTIPGISSDNVNSFLSGAIAKLVEIQQVKEFRRKTPLVREVLDNVRKVYDAEKPLYVQIAQDYDNETYTIAKYLVEHDEASGASVFQQFIEPYGLKTKEPASPDSITREWTLDRIKAQMETRKKAEQGAADSIAESLAHLVEAHDNFMHKKNPTKKP